MNKYGRITIIIICVAFTFTIFAALYVKSERERVNAYAKMVDAKVKIEEDKAWKALIREKYSFGLDGKPLVWGMTDKKSMKYATKGKGEVYDGEQ